MMKLKEKAKALLHCIFIDGFSGMALGLFATLIVGTILAEIAAIGFLKGSFVGNLLLYVANLTKTLMGVGIGVGIAYKFKQSPLVTVASGACGFVGAFAADLIALSLGSGAPLAAISQ